MLTFLRAPRTPCARRRAPLPAGPHAMSQRGRCGKCRRRNCRNWRTPWSFRQTGSGCGSRTGITTATRLIANTGAEAAEPVFHYDADRIDVAVAVEEALPGCWWTGMLRSE